MNKAKLFVENFLIYGLGSVFSRIVPLIMVPIITWLLPTTEYFGLTDLSGTLVQFGSALAIMGMYDSMFRFFFDKEEEDYKKTVCSTAFLFTLGSSCVVCALIIVFRKQIAVLFFKDLSYLFLVYISAAAVFVGATNGIVSAPTRMQNKRRIFLITNTVSPIISYAIAVLLILRGQYVIALPIAGLISSTVMGGVFWYLNRKWFSMKQADGKLLRKMLLFALPLLPNFLVYWLYNSCDRIMITNLVGLDAAGVYAVGSKLGHASQLIYTAFASGWQYFAFSTMNEDNQVKSNSVVFEYLGVISFCATLFICSISYAVYCLVFPAVYRTGFIIAPYLFFAPLLQMLFQVGSNQFLVVKKTWPNLPIMFFGAILNIILNLILIPRMGIEGAALATLAGYAASTVFLVIILSKMKLIILSRRFCLSTMTFLVTFVGWRFLFTQNTIVSLLLFIFFLAESFVLYRKEIQMLFERVKLTIQNKL